MRRSHKTNTLVLISDHTKAIYEDRWASSDLIHFSGIGLEGDQSLTYLQNKTLYESSSSGIAVYLFEVYEPGTYLYRGQVEVAGEPFKEIQPDRNGKPRIVWIFPLRVTEPDAGFTVPADLVAKKQTRKQKLAKRLSDDELFTRAVHSRRDPSNRQVASTAYERNVYVAELIHRRAAGICQLCDQPAPFRTKKNEPYLEPHHIVWLTQGGEDTVENTVALCPNCHTKMHVLNLKEDRKKLRFEAQKNCCQLTIDGGVVYV